MECITDIGTRRLVDSKDSATGTGTDNYQVLCCDVYYEDIRTYDTDQKTALFRWGCTLLSIFHLMLEHSWITNSADELCGPGWNTFNTVVNKESSGSLLDMSLCTHAEIKRVAEPPP